MNQVGTVTQRTLGSKATKVVRGEASYQDRPALALRIRLMATTLATVEAREVLRCERCTLVQFRTANSLCRRCHKPLEVEEPERLVPQFTGEPEETVAEDNSLQVARAVRDLRKGRNLSQRQLASRMQVPRTYISKIENGKAMPTLSSLARLAAALEIDVCHLLRDARSRRHEETASILADPFLAELAPYIAQMDSLQRSMFLNQVRDLAMGRRRSA
jgi:transcriptional regulator with XRE-family HTH domain